MTISRRIVHAQPEMPARKVFATAILIIAVFANICSSWAKSITIDGTGYTKVSAIQNALRGAVEQCIGTSITSATIVKNYTLITDKIVSAASGYVSSHIVDSIWNEFGLVRVKVTAEVSLGKLENDLAAQKLLYALHNKPRIMVALEEKSGNSELFEKTATFAFETALVRHGFIVIDSKENEILRQKIKTANDSLLSAFAFDQGADLIVQGKVSAADPSSRTLYGVQFYSVPVQLNAHILRTDNGQILASGSKSIAKKAREPAAATQAGLTAGGSVLAELLIKDLENYWRDAAYNENRVELAVNGLPQQRFNSFENSIKKVPVVRSITLRYMISNRALYDLELRGSIHDLKAALDNDSSTGLVISYFSSSRMVLQSDTNQSVIEPTNSFTKAAITDFTISPIFPSRLRFYETHPLSYITLDRTGEQATGCKLSVTIPGVMTIPAELNIPAATSDSISPISINLILDPEKVLSNNETKTIYGKVELTCPAAPTASALTAPATVYERNAMDWRTPEAIGAFVTYRSPSIISLASHAVKSVSNSNSGFDKVLIEGMAVFTLLKELGLHYIKDPAAMAGTAVLDRVQFPTETLERGGGDCDDLAVLYAALLSSIGIKTAIVAYPDHVLVMFDTGIYEKNRHLLSFDANKTISYNGTLWIPVETTLTAKGFTGAWQIASREFTAALNEDRHTTIIDLSKAWKIFPPPAIPSTGKPIPFPALNDAVSAEQQLLLEAAHAGLSRQMQTVEGKIKASSGKEKAVQLNKAAILFLRQGNYRKSLAYLKKSLAIEHSGTIVSNIAGVLLLAGDEKKSLELYDSLVHVNNDPRIALNRALCLYTTAESKEQTATFVSAIKQAAESVPDINRLSEYLGIQLSGQEAGKGSQTQGTFRKEINLQRFKALIQSCVMSEGRLAGVTTEASSGSKFTGTTTESSTGEEITGTTTETSTGTIATDIEPVVMPFGGLKGADPDQVAKLRDLLWWFE